MPASPHSKSTPSVEDIHVPILTLVLVVTSLLALLYWWRNRSPDRIGEHVESRSCDTATPSDVQYDGGDSIMRASIIAHDTDTINSDDQTAATSTVNATDEQASAGLRRREFTRRILPDNHLYGQKIRQLSRDARAPIHCHSAGDFQS